MVSLEYTVLSYTSLRSTRESIREYSGIYLSLSFDDYIIYIITLPMTKHQVEWFKKAYICVQLETFYIHIYLRHILLQ